MFHINTLVQKAQSLIEPSTKPADASPSKAALFRLQFHLPDNQNPLHEITAELLLPSPQKLRQADEVNGTRSKSQRHEVSYVGKLHLSESFLCFSTQPTSFTSSSTTQASSGFTGATHGAGPAGNGFTIPLCGIRRVERLLTQDSLFALKLTTWNGNALTSKKAEPWEAQEFTLQLAGHKSNAEKFCDGLKRGLRDGVKEFGKMKTVIVDCYSEHLLSGPTKTEKPADLIAVDVRQSPDVGLGMIFRYPGDAKKLRDRSKIRLWGEYFRDNGRNATLIRQPTFHKLIRVGLPNRLRGEIWELTSGSLYARLQNPTLYADTLKKYEGLGSAAIDEIEKDLNRSLPEYPGFQSEEGIERLRRVLTAYSWTNTDVGYCQAMNIVVAALLIYMSEQQAFSVLSILCDRLLPGYYSMTMFGTLLDQKVFESLVEKTMPILWNHLTKSDVQLSVVSLPWFLSLYINSMPLVFAFRVLDCFFLEGPKVLFQVGLAILRINGEDLLDITDDGNFISVLKNYFSRLGESAHPKSQDDKLRAQTKFQELMVVAFKEFSGITQALISEHRAKHKSSVLDNIESFAKRTSIRNLGPDSKKLDLDDLGFLYDRFYGILYEREQRQHMQREDDEKRAQSRRSKASELINGVGGNTSIEVGRVGLGPSATQMNYDAFREFLANTTRWAVTDSPTSMHKESMSETSSIYSTHSTRSRSFSLSPWGSGPEPADHDFMQRLYGKWNKDDEDGLSLQGLVSGVAAIKGSRDLMSTISYFFELYDDDGDGNVDREGILRMSEALLFLTRRGFESDFTCSTPTLFGSEDSTDEVTMNPNERFLSSVSAFIRRCFEYADPDNAMNQSDVPIDPGHSSDLTNGVNQFSIGDDEDEDEDLLVATPPPTKPTSPTTPRPRRSSAVPQPIDPETDPLSTPVIANPPSPTSSKPTPSKTSANLALDPANPLHITLPTFRMVILADELLQQFFEAGFPNSFHLSPTSATHLHRSSTSSSQQLTTFSSPTSTTPTSLPLPRAPQQQHQHPAPSFGSGVRGLRGMLDSFVMDGRRMAGEVRKQWEEAQKEMEHTSAVHAGAPSPGGRRPTQSSSYEDEEEEEDEKAGGGRDLLEGAEADAGGVGKDLTDSGKGKEGLGLGNMPSGTEAGEKVVSKEDLLDL